MRNSAWGAVLVTASSLFGCATELELERPAPQDASAVEQQALRLQPEQRDWRSAAYDSSGSGFNVGERVLSPRNVSQLQVKWTFDAQAAGAPVAPIHANPVVADRETFVGSFGGTFYAIDAHGQLKWSFETFAPGFWFSAFYGAHAPILGGAVLPETEDSVVFGDIDGRIYKLDRATGALAWSVDLDAHELGGIWGNSLTIVGDTVYVGLASFETLAPFLPDYTCCSHRGAVVAVDLATGATKWRYETIAESEQGPLPQELVDALGTIETYGPSGGDVWSQPTYDAESNTLYVGTGQLFSRAADGSGPSTHDAVIALDAQTGALQWVTHLSDNVDVFRFDTPYHVGGSDQYYDKDVADSPKVYRLVDGRKVVGAAQKNGEYHVLDAATGERITSTAHLEMITGEGGFQSGGATDGERVFEHGVTTSSDPRAPYDGVVMALDRDGSFAQWELALPGSPLFGSLAVANGVLYFQSPFEEGLDASGAAPAWALYAVDAQSGSVLARVPFENSRSLNGPAVSRGRVYAAFGSTFGFGLASPVPEGGVVCLGLPDE